MHHVKYDVFIYVCISSGRISIWTSQMNSSETFDSVALSPLEKLELGCDVSKEATQSGLSNLCKPGRFTAASSPISVSGSIDSIIGSKPRGVVHQACNRVEPNTRATRGTCRCDSHLRQATDAPITDCPRLLRYHFYLRSGHLMTV